LSRIAEYLRLAKRVLRLSLRLGFRILTSSTRVLPDFFVLGPPRSGTTFLYQQLQQRPSYVKPFTKELAYDPGRHLTIEETASIFYLFPANYDQVHKALFIPAVRYLQALYLCGGEDGYRKAFPLRWTMRRASRAHRNAVTGEFTVGGLYCIDPLGTFPFNRVADDARFITVLRDPVEFAVSFYDAETNRGFRRIEAGLSIDDFIRRPADYYLDPMARRRFENQLRAWKPLFAERSYFRDEHYSMVTAMMAYVVFVKNWAARLPRERFLVLSFDDLCNHTNDTMTRVCDFLGIPDIAGANLPRANAGTYVRDRVAEETLAYLRQVSRPYNDELFEFLGRDLGWNADNP
jgi:hypothetical protein